MPLIVTQFHEPNLGMDVESISKTSVGASDEQDITKTSVTVRRPSDFRRYSLSVQKIVSEKVIQYQDDEDLQTRAPLISQTLDKLNSDMGKNVENEPTKYEILEDIDKLLGVFLW